MMSSLRKLIPHSLRETIRRFINAFTPNETMSESKKKWNTLAHKNARYYVLTDEGESITEEQFRSAGQKDFETLVQGDSLLTERLSPFSEKTVLEIGCGIGRITEFFADHFKKVIGVDISEGMIEEGSRRLGGKHNAELIATDGRHFPVQDATCDLVFSFIVFQHMPDVETIKMNLAEIGRVLKPKGLAKIQLRGEAASKKSLFYGPSFTGKEARELLHGLPLSLIKIQGEGERYFWIWLEKH